MMRHFLLVFLFSISSITELKADLPFEKEITLSADCEPLATVGGCINVISGDFFNVNTDLHIDGFEPLEFTHHYESRKFIKNHFGIGVGCQLPWCARPPKTHHSHNYAMILERDGFALPFKGKGDKKYRLDTRALEKGYTNMSRAGLSGRQDLYNARGEYNGEWKVILGDGTVRKYDKDLSRLNVDKRAFETVGILLTKETRPSGGSLQVDYRIEDRGVLFNKWESFSRGGVRIGKFKFYYYLDEKDRLTKCQIKTNTGDFLELSYGKDKKRKLITLSQIVSSQGPTQKWHYEDVRHGMAPILNRIELPEGRFLQMEYDKKANITSLYDAGGRLFKLKYLDEHNQTHVWDAEEYQTTYHYSDDKRITSIEEKESNQTRKKGFVWSDQGRLNRKFIAEVHTDNRYVSTDHYHHLTEYQYDERGNIIKETFYGNLTGERNDTFVKAQETDSYSISYVYSNDDFNLMLKKITPELEIHYNYYPNTVNLYHQITIYNGAIQERIFHYYNSHGALIKTIEDDGSSPLPDCLDNVTTRKITNITPFEDTRHIAFAKPKIIEESYYDAGQIIPLKKTEIYYDGKGRSTGEDVWDANGHHCYSLRKEYDSRGRLISQTDELNRTTHKSYDENNNLIEEELNGKRTLYRYDCSNHLIAKEEICPEGDRFLTEYAYDRLGRLLSTTNAYGQKTTSKYDRFGNEIEQCLPSVGNDTPTIRRTFDLLGRCTSETDENGHTTTTRYNVYGKPISITYPNGELHQFTYFLNGWLKRKQTPHLITHYQYDPKGRVICEETYNGYGHLLKKLQWTYKGHRLLSKIDAKGTETFTHYDGACRLACERTGDKLTSYHYDSLGRLEATEIESRLEKTTYDNAERLIEKCILDKEGTLSSKETYAYDTFDNLIQKTVHQNENTQAIYKATYHSMGWPLLKTDPLNRITTIEYDHHYQNAFGQQVLKTTSTDPAGRVTIEIKDTHDRLARQELYAPDLIYAVDYNYDLAGNKVSESYANFIDGVLTKTYTIQWTYDFRGHMLSIQEGDKVTRFEYDLVGNLVTKIKPNGVAIHYENDLLGRLVRMTAPGIDYTYGYDANDNCIETTDIIQGISQKRSYDIYNALIEEELTPGHKIAYTRDLLGRITQVTLPDNSVVDYSYSPLQLTSITRNNQTFSSFQFDLCQRRLKYRLPTSQTVSTIYDIIGCPIRIDAPQWIQTLDSFDPLNNLLQSTVNDRVSRYSYDGQSQLLSENEKNYKYDSLYNRLQANEVTYNYNTINQIEEIPHDPNGNLLLPSHEYDALDRLVRKDDKQFIYDPFDRLIRIQDNEGMKDLLYMGQDEIGAMAHGTLTELKVIDPNTAVVYAVELDGKLFSTIQDHIGNLVGLVDENGVQSRQYTAYAPAEPVIAPWGFSSKREIDGLVYFGKRFYSPVLARWITPDPIYFEDGPNLYAFVKNNPLTHFDPYGLTGFSLEAGLDFGRGLGMGLLQGGLHPIDTVCDCNCYNTEGPSHIGELVGRSIGVLANVFTFGEGAMALQSARYGSLAMLQGGKWTAGRFFRKSAGAEIAELGNGLGSTMGAKSALQVEEIGTASSSLIKNCGKVKNIRSSGAESVNAITNLNRKLRQLQDAQQTATRTRILPDGRIRYYKTERLSRNKGPTRGSSYVTEYNPATGKVRGWNECYDHLGNVNRVHPKNINGQELVSPHYPLTSMELIR